MTLESIVPTVQMAIGPVILISGVGLLLLTMTNRMARTVDRARAVGGRDESQLAVLLKRARILRASILFASTSALCAALLIIILFVSALAGWPLGGLVGFVFVAGMLSLIWSLVLFIWDVNLSLKALEVQLSQGERR